MLTFENDYSTGAHPKIMAKMLETNMCPQAGYGNDEYSISAKEKIKKACDCPNAEIAFIVGGTLANAVVISSILRPHEGVVSATTVHVSTHEGGAIELTSHKVITLEQKEGKINADQLNTYLEDFYSDGNHEQAVFPGMVYVSHPTEYGTLYSKKELEDISAVCKKFSIPLYLDGARLGYGLMSSKADLTLKDIARICDVFYIGGTKVGALCGEAVIFTKNNMPTYFKTLLKQHGALLAKGRLMALQFDILFEDGLYFELGKNAVDMADKLKKLFTDRGYKLFLDSPTNQQFIILENKEMESLQKKVVFSFWEKYDQTHTVVRFATTWSTTREEIDQLAEILDAQKNK